MNKSTSSLFTKAMMDAILNKTRELENLISEATECLLASNYPLLGEDFRLMDLVDFRDELHCLSRRSQDAIDLAKELIDKKIEHYSEVLKKSGEVWDPITMYADSRVALYKRCLESRSVDQDQAIYNAEEVHAEEQENEGEKTLLDQTEILEDQDQPAFDAQQVTNAEEKKEEYKKAFAEKIEEAIQSAESSFCSTEESKDVQPEVSSQNDDSRENVEEQKEEQQVAKEEQESAVKDQVSPSVEQTTDVETSIPAKISPSNPPNQSSWARIAGSAANKPAAYVPSVSRLDLLIFYLLKALEIKINRLF